MPGAESLSCFLVCKLKGGSLSSLTFNWLDFHSMTGATHTCVTPMLALRLSLPGTRELSLLCLRMCEITHLITLIMSLLSQKKTIKIDKDNVQNIL